MQKVAKEYMTTMRSAAVQARLKAGQTPITASPHSLTQPEVIQQCFAARDGRLLGTLAKKMSAAGQSVVLIAQRTQCHEPHTPGLDDLHMYRFAAAQVSLLCCWFACRPS